MLNESLTPSLACPFGLLLYPIAGSELKIYDSARADGTGIAGEVVSVGGDGVTVQAEGGRILIKRVRPTGGGKMAASEWAAAVGINSGTKLGS